MSVLYSTDSGGCRSYQKIQNTSKYASSVKPPRQTQTHHVKMDQANTKSKDSKSNNCHFALLWNWSLRSWAIIQKHAREASLALHVVAILTEMQLDLKIDPWCEGQARWIGYENKRKAEKNGTIRCGPVSSVEKKENAEENSWAASWAVRCSQSAWLKKCYWQLVSCFPESNSRPRIRRNSGYQQLAERNCRGFSESPLLSRRF